MTTRAEFKFLAVALETRTMLHVRPLLLVAALTLPLAAPALGEKAGPSALSACGKHQQRAEKHERKARAFDRKALALRGEAERSQSAARKLKRLRRLTRKHARAQERSNRRYTRCKLKLIRGPYEGTLADTELPVGFKVTRNGKWVKGFRADVEMECRGQNGAEPTTIIAEFALPGRVAVGEAGDFRAETDTRADPAYVVSGHLRDGKATGVVSYSTGSVRDLSSAFCRTSAARWAAKRR